MPDAQTLELIEALERRVANLEILEDPVTQLINDVASDVSQDFTAQVFTVWNNSEIVLTLEEEGYIWWGYQFWSLCDTIRTNGMGFQVFINGVAHELLLRQGYDLVDSRESHTLVGRSDTSLAAGVYTIDVRIIVSNINDTISGRNLTGYAFWTRQ